MARRRPATTPEYDRDLLASRGLDLDLAFQCVELAWLVYRDPLKAGAMATERFGYQYHHHLSRRDGRDHAFVVRDAHYTVVAFRGSDQINDWLTNLRMWTIATPWGGVHRGYHDVANSFSEELRAILADDPQQRPVVLTGHSMGGAIAVLAGLLLGDRFAPGGIFTFGQPQVGTRAFVRAFADRYPAPLFRFVNGADAIAAWTYGPRALMGTPCYFDQRGRLVFGDHFSELPRLGLRFHRLDHYRHYLRLNRLRLALREESSDATVLVDR